MRSRFFIVIYSVILIVSFSCVLLNKYLIQIERKSFIDQQVRETASALIDSELGDLRIIDFDNADSIISEELGESRIGKFFIIRNKQGEILFQTTTAKLLPIVEVPLQTQWYEITTKDKYIRALNLQLPRFPDRMLQVGIVIDQKIIYPDYLSTSSWLFICGAIVIGLIVSIVLTSYLFNPLSKLIQFLSTVSENAQRQADLPTVPKQLYNMPLITRNDEFTRTLDGLNSVIEMMNKNQKVSRMWAYQMAHELKTPLTIMNLEIEKLQSNLRLPKQKFHSILSEGHKISETIGSFLGWAELEGTSQSKHLFLNKVSQLTKIVVDRFSKLYQNRIHLTAEHEPTVAASPQHLEQVITNLISNALQHTPASEPVKVTLNKYGLRIEDFGPGISDSVLDRLGEPFNKGATSQYGHGLGLAWVKSICRLYAWELNINTSHTGTQVDILFSKTSEL